MPTKSLALNLCLTLPVLLKFPQWDKLNGSVLPNALSVSVEDELNVVTISKSALQTTVIPEHFDEKVTSAEFLGMLSI